MAIYIPSRSVLNKAVGPGLAVYHAGTSRGGDADNGHDLGGQADEGRAADHASGQTGPARVRQRRSKPTAGAARPTCRPGSSRAASVLGQKT